MTDENKLVLYQLDGGVARITLNRPEKRNALNDALVAGLKDSLAKANDNEAVRVIVITGAGNDFSSGADLSALQKIATASVAENIEDARSLMGLFLLIRQVKVPVIAAVRVPPSACRTSQSSQMVRSPSNSGLTAARSERPMSR